mgnify:CR=1 FL=1
MWGGGPCAEQVRCRGRKCPPPLPPPSPIPPGSFLQPLVTFQVILNGNLDDFNPDETRSNLAAALGIPAASIGLTAESASVRVLGEVYMADASAAQAAVGDLTALLNDGARAPPCKRLGVVRTRRLRDLTGPHLGAYLGTLFRVPKRPKWRFGALKWVLNR